MPFCAYMYVWPQLTKYTCTCSAYFRLTCKLWLASCISKYASQLLFHPNLMHNVQTIRCTYTNILHTKQLLCYGRHSFCILDWQATSANIYHHHFSVQHFERTQHTQVKTTGSYSITTHWKTPLLPRMLNSMLKASKRWQSASHDPVLTLLSH